MHNSFHKICHKFNRTIHNNPFRIQKYLLLHLRFPNDYTKTINKTIHNQLRKSQFRYAHSSHPRRPLRPPQPPPNLQKFQKRLRPHQTTQTVLICFLFKLLLLFQYKLDLKTQQKKK